MNLAEQNCKPASETVRLSISEAQGLLSEIPAWSPAGTEIKRQFRFKDFRQSMEFVNDVAALANKQDHHPDIFISYNKVQLTLSTHKIGGLSMNDFIMAAKIDRTAERRIGKKAA